MEDAGTNATPAISPSGGRQSLLSKKTLLDLDAVDSKSTTSSTEASSCQVPISGELLGTSESPAISPSGGRQSLLSKKTLLDLDAVESNSNTSPAISPSGGRKSLFAKKTVLTLDAVDGNSTTFSSEASSLGEGWSAASQARLRVLGSVARRMRETLTFENRSWMGRSYKNVWDAKAILDWLVNQSVCGSRKEALEMGRALQKQKLIVHVWGSHTKLLPFQDTTMFFRCNDEVIDSISLEDATHSADHSFVSETEAADGAGAGRPPPTDTVKLCGAADGAGAGQPPPPPTDTIKHSAHAVATVCKSDQDQELDLPADTPETKRKLPQAPQDSPIFLPPPRMEDAPPPPLPAPAADPEDQEEGLAARPSEPEAAAMPTMPPAPTAADEPPIMSGREFHILDACRAAQRRHSEDSEAHSRKVSDMDDAATDLSPRSHCEPMSLYSLDLARSRSFLDEGNHGQETIEKREKRVSIDLTNFRDGDAELGEDLEPSASAALQRKTTVTDEVQPQNELYEPACSPSDAPEDKSAPSVRDAARPEPSST